MADREDLIKHILDLAVVHGKVTLASGKEADYYVDLRRVTLDGAAAPVVGRVMRALTADWVRPILSPAAAKLPSRTTATNVLSSRIIHRFY